MTIKTEKGEISRIRLTDNTVSKEEIKDIVNSRFEDLRHHVRRCTTQYKELEYLSNHLRPGEITLQMDYSENYACIYQDEPSALYFDKHQMTMHPMVTHFRNVNNVLVHKSIIGISSETKHSAPTTVAFLRKVVPLISDLIGLKLVEIHYVSDSPVSQYRNRSIVRFLKEHKKEMGMNADWTYFEAGHGKGPCDGVGGALKHAAELAVRKGTIISDATQMFQWASQSADGFPSVKHHATTPAALSAHPAVGGQTQVLERRTLRHPKKMSPHTFRWKYRKK